MKYTLLDDGTVERINDDASKSYIPNDPSNADYQAYLNKDNPEYGKPQKL